MNSYTYDSYDLLTYTHHYSKGVISYAHHVDTLTIIMVIVAVVTLTMVLNSFCH